ncbi:MAG: hypothetical protein QXO80_03610 [Thermosphaera sp.]
MDDAICRKDFSECNEIRTAVDESVENLLVLTHHVKGSRGQPLTLQAHSLNRNLWFKITAKTRWMRRLESQARSSPLQESSSNEDLLGLAHSVTVLEGPSSSLV